MRSGNGGTNITDEDAWTLMRKFVNEDEHEEAFYICDLSDIVKKYETWRQLMPRVHPHYAVKCNPTRAVLETLAALGANFDCASKDELSQILSIGVPPERIIFANPTKQPGHIEFAASTGVSLMTFDNETELCKAKNLSPEAEMVIRIRYDDPKARYRMGLKFGCDYRNEAPRLLKKARSLGVDVVGVSFHIGCPSEDASVFRGAIEAAAEVFRAAREVGFRLRLLDIGGGFPGDKGTTIEGHAEIINRALRDFFPDPAVEVISEPGRFFVSSAFTLATRIHSSKTVKVENSEDPHYHYYIDTGIYNNFTDILFEKTFTCRPLLPGAGETHVSTVWGVICDPSDVICKAVMLPELQVGDWLVFEDQGAYTISIASSFNGYPAPQMYTTIDTRSWSLLKKKNLNNLRPIPVQENGFSKNGLKNKTEHWSS